ncbi:MAG: hypothetical protein FWD45_01260 [Coriobacteriia bacterium]|nr:hypothetical protein [Coriobacteriia bacterium]
MQSVILVMQELLEAQRLMLEMGNYPRVKAASINNYEKFYNSYRYTHAKTYLIEVLDDEDRGIDFCLALARLLREKHPESRLVLLSSEQDEACTKAKQEKLIDTILPRGSSLSYLAAQLVG